MPIFMVAVDDGHVPQAPSRRSSTVPPSTAATETSPPSATRYGRTFAQRKSPRIRSDIWDHVETNTGEESD